MTLEIGFYFNDKEVDNDPDILDKVSGHIQETLKEYEYWLDYGNDGITASIEIDESNKEEKLRYVKELINAGVNFCCRED